MLCHLTQRFRPLAVHRVSSTTDCCGLYPTSFLWQELPQRQKQNQTKKKKQKSKTNKINKQTKIKAKQKQKTSLKLLTLSDKYVLSFQEMRLTSQY